MLRWWTNWMLVKPWLLLKYLARHESLERKQFQDFSVWSHETWMESPPYKISYCLYEVSQNQLNCWNQTKFTVPLDSESKHEVFIQSWASQIALDNFFFYFSKYHSIVPVHRDKHSDQRPCRYLDQFTLQTCRYVSIYMSCTGFAQGKWIIPSSATAFSHCNFAPICSWPLKMLWCFTFRM